MGNPLLSIVTPTRNSAGTLPALLESLKALPVELFEHIVVDGESSDETEAIVKGNAQNLHWIASPARGISNAFNVGISRSRGRFIKIINSDDILIVPAFLRQLEALAGAGNPLSYSYSDMLICDVDGRDLHRLRADSQYTGRIRYYCPVLNHPTYIVPRELYECVGGYNERLRVVMDYEWALRASKRGVTPQWFDAVTVRMRLGGQSSDVVAALREEYTVSRAEVGWKALPVYGFRRAKAWLGPRVNALPFSKVMRGMRAGYQALEKP